MEASLPNIAEWLWRLQVLIYISMPGAGTVCHHVLTLTACLLVLNHADVTQFESLPSPFAFSYHHHIYSCWAHGTQSRHAHQSLLQTSLHIACYVLWF